MTGLGDIVVLILLLFLLNSDGGKSQNAHFSIYPPDATTLTKSDSINSWTYIYQLSFEAKKSEIHRLLGPLGLLEGP